jgi:hypothetical protein
MGQDYQVESTKFKVQSKFEVQSKSPAGIAPTGLLFWKNTDPPDLPYPP